MKIRLIVWLAITVLTSLVEGQFEYFTDDPPDDYFKRKSLDDCPIRFYWDMDKFNVHYAFGGVRAVRGEFQHMAAIGWNNSGSIKYLCGGSLITSRFVLTAAHCVADGEGKPPVTVRLGDTNLNSTEDVQFSQQVRIKALKRHPQYRFSRKYYDIALIELEEEVKFNEAICPACLWLEENAPTEQMNAVGFGVTGFGEELSPTLQKVNLSEIDKDDCLRRLPKNSRALPEGLVQSQFCAASDHQDTCEGDSGGPLQIERLDVSNVMVPLIAGVVSFGTPCTEGSTGVYTRVAAYRDWIEKETGRSFSYSTCARTSGCHTRKHVRSNIDSPPSAPFHRVGLLWNHTDLNEFQCGGTLVDYKFVLTSAHCARFKQGFPKLIVVGDSKQIVSIESVHIHPMYTPDKPENDLALLKLTKYLNPRGDMLPACLWREDEVKDEYGQMHYSTYSSRFDSLKYFHEDVYNRYVIGTKIEENGKCTNTRFRSKNLLCGQNNVKLIPTVCKIDYGGPVSNKANFQWTPYVYGVVSTLSESCENELVGTRIAPHLQWIEDTILNHNNDQLIFVS
uniref:Serine protease snake n=1 Tax=Culex pipiens TaxID=7175 RepID=A0A8D8FDR4_CULPI